MDLKQLNTFVKVAELGSLSKASAQLHIAQPALSRPSTNAVEKFAGELQTEVAEMVESGVWGGRLLTD